jgi:hypothetical protein
MTSNFPEVNQIYADLQSVLEKLLALDASKIESANLVPMVKAVQAIGGFQAAVHAQIEERAIANKELVPGVLVKDKVTHRKWHDEETAMALAVEQFGEKALKPRELISVAAMEKLGKDGKMFVAVASYKPEGDKTVAY